MDNGTTTQSPENTQGSLRGRFSEATDEFVKVFTASVNFDQRLYREDIAGSRAHATMLQSIGVLDDGELQQILQGLQTIQDEIESGAFKWQIDLEDVHMNIEHRLIELIGDTGKKLHTGRSRNDQVATDIRLHLRGAIDALVDQQSQLLSALADLAEQNADTIMPGFTHLQAAQPITFGHHMMAWFEMLRRDRDRLLDCRKRLNQPLETRRWPFSLMRVSGKPFDFDGVCENSLDAVSDRDFAIEFCLTAALTSPICPAVRKWCSGAGGLTHQSAGSFLYRVEHYTAEKTRTYPS